MKRRRFIGLAPAAALAGVAPSGRSVRAQAPSPAQRAVPAPFRNLPPIGLGTWLTFDVGDNAVEQEQRRQVLLRFFAAGGGMIDSSPMYGQAEWLLGQLLPTVPHEGRLFAASKVWTPFDRMGPGQLEQSLKLWGIPRFDTLLVHNILNWRAHLKTLRQWKDAGRVRAIGISTSHGNKHDEALRVLRSESLDVLQITYNMNDERAEPLMNLAAERGMAVVINRPLDGGYVFERAGGRPLPDVAIETGCANWSQVFLKWVIAHPTVTCAIPATRQPLHAAENMGAGVGPRPDAPQRRRMLAAYRAL